MLKPPKAADYQSSLNALTAARAAEAKPSKEWRTWRRPQTNPPGRYVSSTSNYVSSTSNLRLTVCSLSDSSSKLRLIAETQFRSMGCSWEWTATKVCVNLNVFDRRIFVLFFFSNAAVYSTNI